MVVGGFALLPALVGSGSGLIALVAFGCAFAAKSGFLDASEWNDLVREDPFVDTDHAGFELFRDAPGSREVARKQIGCEAEGCPVGKGYGFGFGLKAHQRCNGAEDLFRHK